MTLIRAAAATVFDQGTGRTARRVATPSLGAKELAIVWATGTAAPDVQAHMHDHEEVTVVLAGSIGMMIGTEEHILQAGDSAIIPAGTLHRPLGPVGVARYEVLVIHPAGTKFLDIHGGVMPPRPSHE